MHVSMESALGGSGIRRFDTTVERTWPIVACVLKAVSSSVRRRNKPKLMVLHQAPSQLYPLPYQKMQSSWIRQRISLLILSTIRTCQMSRTQMPDFVPPMTNLFAELVAIPSHNPLPSKPSFPNGSYLIQMSYIKAIHLTFLPHLSMVID